MAFTSDDLALINAAIAAGVRVVRYADKTVEYQDTADMLKARDAILRDIAATDAGGSANVKRYSFAGFTK